MITQEVKERLIADYPKFEDMTRKFYKKEMSIVDYKGQSGAFGSYAERGAETGMSRWRFNGGRITRDQMQFLAGAIRKYNLKHVHFTTGQCLQMHGLDGETILSLFKECYEHGIYNRGAGGDNPSNLVASILRGIDPRETFDITPYATAIGEYILEQMFFIKIPRKFKMGIDNGFDSTPHATFKDLGFNLNKHNTFDVYACGGIGPNPRIGIPVARDVAPEDVLYHVKAMLMVFANHGNFKNRGKARTRYMPADMGGAEPFIKVYEETLNMVKEVENLTVDPARYAYEITKSGKRDDSVLNHRIHRQKQEGLYYVEYHPVGGDADVEHLLAALDYAVTLDQVEARIAPDEAIFFINLTADEARKIASLTDDSAVNDFRRSVSCVGATVCQIGMQDSNGLLKAIFTHLDEKGIDTKKLPRLHISGCPHSCGTHQIGEIGFHGSVKLVDKKPQPAFILVDGGSEHMGSENFGKMAGNIVSTKIPEFMEALANILNEAPEPDFGSWRLTHKSEYMNLIKSFE
ncbi:ferredoxin [Veillonella denticariosi JCM 15641]|uniref:Ferredoxin n=1 Tax=Veillonella denticariosi JCM 15641 TaxID=1298594 RepID=A0A2S7ZAH7_9FIRM|nr:nitrite/sulfite reductase [Veillonella denticariosi]PQL20219.1 ferredoxin [Veillonella denticariosi JCM 15641]